MPNLVIKNEIPLKFLHFFSLPLKKKFVLYIFVEKRKKKNDGKDQNYLSSIKKILPSITDSSIRIGVIFLRIETGPNALLALFFFIYDGVASRFLLHKFSIIIPIFNVISNRDQCWIQMYLLHT